MKRHNAFHLLKCYCVICTMLLSCFLTKAQSISPAGIGPVRIGAAVRSLPKSAPGLYDKLEIITRVEYEYGDEFEVTVGKASLGGTVLFEFDSEDRKVDNISILSPKLKTEHGFGLQSTPAELFSAGGFVVTGNAGVAGVYCDGALFVGIPMTSSGQKKAEQVYLGYAVTFTVSDFVAGKHATKVYISSIYADLARPSQPVFSTPEAVIEEMLRAERDLDAKAYLATCEPRSRRFLGSESRVMELLSKNREGGRAVKSYRILNVEKRDENIAVVHTVITFSGGSVEKWAYEVIRIDDGSWYSTMLGAQE